MSIFSKTQTQTYTLVIGLKSSSVDVQLIADSGSYTKDVLFAERAVIFLGDSCEPSEYTNKCMAELVRLLKEASGSIAQIVQKQPINTKVILYAPWFTSSITEHVHPKKVFLTEAFLKKQLNEVRLPANLIRLENKIIKILTNGYSINQPTRNELPNVTLQIYSSYISEKIFNRIEKSIKSTLPVVGDIEHQTSPLLFFEQIKNLLVREDNICFVYVGGEITEVGIIEDDLLAHYSTFPIGKHDFLREIQGVAHSYDYDLLYQKEIQIKSKKKQDSFNSLKEQWKKNLIQSLNDSNKIVPSKILIISDSKTKDFFSKLIGEQLHEPENDNLINYRIINFDLSHLKDIISYKTPTNTTELDLQLEALI